jgi:hypothetical protein
VLRWGVVPSPISSRSTGKGRKKKYNDIKYQILNSQGKKKHRKRTGTGLESIGKVSNMIGTGEQQDMNRKETEEEQERIRRRTGEDQDGTELEQVRNGGDMRAWEEQEKNRGTLQGHESIGTERTRKRQKQERNRRLKREEQESKKRRTGE